MSGILVEPISIAHVKMIEPHLKSRFLSCFLWWQHKQYTHAHFSTVVCNPVVVYLGGAWFRQRSSTSLCIMCSACMRGSWVRDQKNSISNSKPNESMSLSTLHICQHQTWAKHKYVLLVTDCITLLCIIVCSWICKTLTQDFNLTQCL